MKKAFSLVELSIVLVILGLIVGGIIAGQSLIRNAELNSISSDFNRYAAAIANFQDQYNALPGDLINATAYWNKDNTNCAGHTGTAGAPGTCNGDGNGQIVHAAGANATGEAFQMWRQLQLAGLIEGNYSGLSGSVGGADYDFGVNAPASSVEGAGWGHYGFNNSAGGSSYQFAYDYNGWFALGAEGDNNLPDAPVLSPKEAWQIDRKMDDGRPGMGLVHTIRPAACTTATGTAQLDFDAEYDISLDSAECAPLFRF